jgi:hypothetical protein
MSQPTKVFAIAAAGAWLFGATACSLPAPAGRKPAAAPSVTLSTANRPEFPVEPAPVLRPAPESVYRNPKIGVVYLRAHQDAEGRLLGPQVMYQMTDPGGWNVEAADQGNGYIPPADLEIPTALASPYLVPAAAAPPLPANVPLLDPDAAARITITGLMKPEDKAQAEAMARQMGGSCLAVYDDQAGWLLMPRR